jgi:predicted transcriptional regulator
MPSPGAATQTRPQPRGITVRPPEELRLRLRRAAAARDSGMSHVVLLAIAEWLDRHEAERMGE